MGIGRHVGYIQITEYVKVLEKAQRRTFCDM